MKKIFTLISVVFVAMSVNAQAPEEYLAIDDEGNYNAEFKAIVGDDGVTANNVSTRLTYLGFSSEST